LAANDANWLLALMLSQTFQAAETPKVFCCFSSKKKTLAYFNP
jgi:hypothetical protein